MSDVTAIILSMGEPTTAAAIASARCQSLPPREIVIVENVSPFHEAWNRAAARVRTDFFVQVDSDFRLDENCFAELRMRVADDAGVVSAPLRDALMGSVEGVKLFRTACLQYAKFTDSISPDTDFYRDIQRHGYRRLRYDDPRAGAERPVRTLGEHRPDYTPLYTYSKYRLLGARYRYRRDLEAFSWRARELARNRLPVALFAQVGLSRGLFLEYDRDLLRPYARDRDFEIVEAFAGSATDDADGREAASEVSHLLSSHTPGVYRSFREWGRALSRRGGVGVFRSVLHSLNTCDERRAWIARVALCQGVCAAVDGPRVIDRELAVLQELALLS